MEGNLLRALFEWVVLSVTVWTISTTIARARVFRPIRALVKARSDFFGEGVSCQYCISHWVAFALTLVYRPELLPAAHWPVPVAPWLVQVVDYFISAFAVIGLAALIARNLGKTPPDGIHPDQKEWDQIRAEAVRLAPEVQPVLTLAEKKVKTA
ncbi:MAG: hypothetical protein ACM3ZB_07250 [bacterium]|jgi:hypothetical protein